jgi:hypothetical protein
MPFNPQLQALNDRVWNEVARRPGRPGAIPVAVPETIPLDQAQLESRFGDDLPVLDHLERAIALAEAHELADIARGFAAVENQLRWSQNPSYDASNCDPSFLAGYAYAAFSGPDAPLRCLVPRGGILLMAPNVTYPDHHHAPREVYLVLTPGSQWRLDSGEWFEVAPGDLIFHERWQMHAMRTRDDPLLAFAGWLETGERKAISWSEPLE